MLVEIIPHLAHNSLSHDDTQVAVEKRKGCACQNSDKDKEGVNYDEVKVAFEDAIIYNSLYKESRY
jgi:hypothetical protein